MRKKAYDLLIQAESGLISVTGTEDMPSLSASRSPTSPPGCMRCPASPRRCCAVAEPGGCQRQDRDAGRARRVDDLSDPPRAYANSPPPRSQTRHPAIAPYGSHRTKDGQVIFGLQNEREWLTFCENVLDGPGIATDPRFRDSNAGGKIAMP